MERNKFDISRVSNKSKNEAFEQAVNVYIEAFSKPPYNELFSPEEAYEALQYILDKNGDLLFASQQDAVVGLAGGYMRKDGSYYLEELAVSPEKQGLGIGRALLERLIDAAMSLKPNYLELRTTNSNTKAIKLYESEGFKPALTEVAVQKRQNGKIGLDERVRMQKPPINPESDGAKILQRVAIAYPSGNTTAVVFDQLLYADREILNDQIMQTWKNYNSNKNEVEQCCFVTLPTSPNAIAKVEMFGGEYCGNATRSAVWLLTKGENYQGYIEVSGAQKPLEFSVSSGNVSLEMPLPTNCELSQVVAEGILVQLDGISQLVVTNPDIRNKQTARELLNYILTNNKYGLENTPAVGVSYFDTKTKKAQFCVWVKKVNTIFDETACGSGTCAIAMAQAVNNKNSIDADVIQPSGQVIDSQAVYDPRTNTITKSVISGKVSVIFDGRMELE